MDPLLLNVHNVHTYTNLTGGYLKYSTFWEKNTTFDDHVSLAMVSPLPILVEFGVRKGAYGYYKNLSKRR
jgi:hypothetical protein